MRGANCELREVVPDASIGFPELLSQLAPRTSQSLHASPRFCVQSAATTRSARPVNWSGRAASAPTGR